MNNLPIGSNLDPNAPWKQNNSLKSKSIEHIEIWINDSETKEFLFDLDINECNDGDDISINVSHCYNKLELPDTHEIEVTDYIKDRYGIDTVVEFDL